MNCKRIKAYGKVNIGLDITSIRDDGYHLLKTVFQTIRLHDDILVRKWNDGIMIKANLPYIPRDERNLAYKAAAEIIKRYDIKSGVRIDIGKKIPVGGGLAGGSTDGAAVIEAMNELFALKMDIKEKDDIALRLGADVPFCLRRGCFLAEGIGEKLTRLNDMPGFDVLICAPSFPVSTKWAYGAYDEEHKKFHPDVDGLVEAIKARDEKAIADRMGNSLEQVVEKEHPEIKKIKDAMESFGASKAMMSGSGSVVFGLYKGKGEAAQAYRRMKKDYPKGLYLTEFVKGE